jgi:hypothetical protein
LGAVTLFLVPFNLIDPQNANRTSAHHAYEKGAPSPGQHDFAGGIGSVLAGIVTHSVLDVLVIVPGLISGP